jgi:ATP-dependent RNA helicase DDX18/HAS1
LDLAKVGRAFGFSVPPRVNVTVGGGSGGNGRPSAKRKREEIDEADGAEDDVISENADQSRDVSRSKTKQRRKEQLGGRKMAKEVYRNTRPKEDGDAQWSR